MATTIGVSNVVSTQESCKCKKCKLKLAGGKFWFQKDWSSFGKKVQLHLKWSSRHESRDETTCTSALKGAKLGQSIGGKHHFISSKGHRLLSNSHWKNYGRVTADHVIHLQTSHASFLCRNQCLEISMRVEKEIPHLHSWAAALTNRPRFKGFRSTNTSWNRSDSRGQSPVVLVKQIWRQISRIQAPN